MKKGDRVLYYHSGESKEVVGIARVDKAAYPDPTAKEGDWVAVDLAPLKALKQPVGLSVIKSDKALQAMTFVRQGRLSVSPVTEAQFRRLLQLSGTTT
jgi:predicted RNA-binding protein with PUA-like domain